MMLKHIIDPEVEEYDDVYDDDEKAAQEGYLRVVDESQEDYLYPEFYFIFATSQSTGDSRSDRLSIR